MISIIIPTLNEEKYLPLLLDSIKKQKYRCEVIVVDTFSKDKTVKIARKYGCKVIMGHFKNPGDSRNGGAKKASGDLLLFLDADVILSKDFLKKNIGEFQRRKLDVASCYAIPLSKKIVDKLFYGSANIFLKFMQRIKPFAHGFCIFCKKEVHEKINGFNTALKFGEDSDYVLKASKIAKFRMLRSKKILASVRRMDKEGRLIAYSKYLAYNFYRLFF